MDQDKKEDPDPCMYNTYKHIFRITLLFIPFGVRAAAVYADTFSTQHLDGRIRQKVKLSLYACPFMCLSVFPL